MKAVTGSVHLPIRCFGGIVLGLLAMFMLGDGWYPRTLRDWGDPLFLPWLLAGILPLGYRQSVCFDERELRVEIGWIVPFWIRRWPAVTVDGVAYDSVENDEGPGYFHKLDLYRGLHRIAFYRGFNRDRAIDAYRTLRRDYGLRSRDE